MPNLRDSIHHLAQSFATGVLHAIRGASLEDILGESSGPKRSPGRPPSQRGLGRPSAVAPAFSAAKPSKPSKRLARRSADDISKVAGDIVSLVKKHKSGLRAEQIRAQLGIAKREWMRPLEFALSSKRIAKKGEKRATTYFAK
jgi:hypothetical protein